MVKRWLPLVVVLALMLAMVSVDAGAQKKKKKRKPTPPPPPPQQVVEGSIMLMAPAPSDPDSCFSGLHRRLFLAFGETAQGRVGYHFDVDPATAGGNFVLEPTAGSNIDLDIVFYTTFGDQTAAGETRTYEARGSTPETGTIPPEMPKAIVCMYSGTQSRFKYTGTGLAPTPATGGTPAPSPSPTST